MKMRKKVKKNILKLSPDLDPYQNVRASALAQPTKFVEIHWWKDYSAKLKQTRGKTEPQLAEVKISKS